MQIAPRYPAGDLPIRHPESEELPAAYHPVLPRRNARHPQPGVCAADCTASVRFMPHTPMVAGVV
jgi:hypothetical protein